MEDLEQIRAFKRVIEHPSDDEDLDSDFEVITTNRNNKLKQGARYVSSRSIAVPEDTLGVTIVDYNGHKRAVLTRKVSGKENRCDQGDSDEEQVGALDDVDLNSILKPVADPAEIPGHPAISRTFTSTNLADLAKETLDVIVDEKAHAAKISNLLSAFLGDDPKSLSLDRLGVVPYTGDASRDAEAFFAPPDTSMDKNYGVSSDTAEEARQLLQIAHQRLEEFIQCMTTIRSGFTHANYKRRKVLNWCRELNHEDYVEEDIGPEEVTEPWSAINDYKNQVSASATERSE